MTEAKPRIDLAKAHPLPAPLVLFVEPTNICNFRCGICPESFADFRQQAGYYKAMEWATWGRIVASLDGWCSPVVRFYHVGEPLLNGNLPAMIREAKALGCRTELTTNAALLYGKRAEGLLHCGLDYMRISVYGTDEADYEWETGRVAHGAVLANARSFRMKRGNSGPWIHAELVTSRLGGQREFRRQWASIADELSVKSLHNWGASLVAIGETGRKQVCPYPFFELAVKANGDVTVCCVDWSGLLTVGNVLESTLQEIWEGPRLRELRETHLSGNRRSLAACRDCNVLEACPDNLDSLVPVGAVQ